MTVSKSLVLAGRLAILLVVAILAGIGVFVVCAVLGRDVLMWRYGENLAPIDDTLPMVLAVRAALLISVAIAVLIFGFGCWRFVVHPLRSGRQRASAAHPDEPPGDPAP